MTPDHARQRAGRYAVMFAGIGVVVALGLAAVMGFAPMVGAFSVATGVGALACITAARWVGRRSALRVAYGTSAGASMAGSCIALAALVSGVMSGSLLQLAADGVRDRVPDWSTSFVGYIVAPLVWVLLLGAIPAIGMGIGYGLTMRRVCQNERAS